MTIRNATALLAWLFLALQVHVCHCEGPSAADIAADRGGCSASCGAACGLADRDGAPGPHVCDGCDHDQPSTEPRDNARCASLASCGAVGPDAAPAALPPSVPWSRGSRLVRPPPDPDGAKLRALSCRRSVVLHL